VKPSVSTVVLLEPLDAASVACGTTRLRFQAYIGEVLHHAAPAFLVRVVGHVRNVNKDWLVGPSFASRLALWIFTPKSMANIEDKTERQEARRGELFEAAEVSQKHAGIILTTSPKYGYKIARSVV
jgi:hypothetical protein